MPDPDSRKNDGGEKRGGERNKALPKLQKSSGLMIHIGGCQV